MAVAAALVKPVILTDKGMVVTAQPLAFLACLERMLVAVAAAVPRYLMAVMVAVGPVDTKVVPDQLPELQILAVGAEDTVYLTLSVAAILAAQES